MNPEVLKDLTEWHDSLEDRKNHEEEHLEDYVREHKRKGVYSVISISIMVPIWKHVKNASNAVSHPLCSTVLIMTTKKT